jgi:sodium/hydrogen exchanger-like protein 6/7
MLKHSYLHLYPSIESCLVALSAYTCYFFSNGLSMSGIVSLLFCGITLKHYAYHTMSHRTQRATKYIFSTLAQLTENFIFIYLGMSLFTSAPVSESVTNYVRPVFIVIATISVVFTRYVAVFPLSQAINFFHKHARGQRHEELPHSYQMMLFWAGLRGAVGVALAAGFKGPNAQMMRTTVLIVVVLTVVIFGGTTARMLEVLGIRTGVEDDAGGSSDEDEPMPVPGRNAWVGLGGNNGRGSRFLDDESSAFVQPPNRIGTHYNPRLYNHHHQFLNQNMNNNNNNNNSLPLSPAASSDSYDSDGDVLPLVPAPSENVNNSSHPLRANISSMVSEDGKWFQALDKRYLLPIFSNATASRTFHARRARRSSGVPVDSMQGSAMGTPGDSEDEVDLGGQEIELLGRPMGNNNNNNNDVGGNNVGGGGGGGSSSNNNIITNPRMVDGSRTERGLPSPVLRSMSTSNESRLSLS